MSALATRRALFGASAAAVLVGAAGQGKAAAPDSRLLELTAELEGTWAEIARLNADPAADIDGYFDRTLDAFWRLSDEIAGIPARTPEGIQAKAKALRLVHRCIAGHEADDTDQTSRHMLGLLRDMLGEG